ncbi:MAG: Maf family nucleotide pyrophosphatase [Alphaproteobacteria bacterium]|nr:Maf family nucleotide pyrophosphatase [Alphaproteobacteria bacterium]
MQLTKKLTLASKSKIRAAILSGAGLDFSVQVSGVDEDALKNTHKGAAEALALALAEAKAKATERAAGDGGLIIGADQILECDGVLYDKPDDMEEARHNLKIFRGQTHYLVGAVVLVEDGQTVWSHCGRVALTMRDFSDVFLDAYLATAGEQILSSVGGYQLEGLGAHLFAHIDGDYFSILGLPLLPLLNGLRVHGGLVA